MSGNTATNSLFWLMWKLLGSSFIVNGIATVSDYLMDENGNIVLDENGNAIIVTNS